MTVENAPLYFPDPTVSPTVLQKIPYRNIFNPCNSLIPLVEAGHDVRTVITAFQNTRTPFDASVSTPSLSLTSVYC